jgi:hypothetical protein
MEEGSVIVVEDWSELDALADVIIERLGGK